MLDAIAALRKALGGLAMAALVGLLPMVAQAAPDLAVSGQVFGSAELSSAPVSAEIAIAASTTDSNGNTYVAGTFRPTMTGATLTVGQQSDGSPVTLVASSAAGLGFVAKFDKDRKVAWANSFNVGAFTGTTPNYTISALTIDSASPPNVYVVGQLTAAAMQILPATTWTKIGTTDSFLLKIPAAGGSPTMVKQYGGANVDLKVTSVVVDSVGRIRFGGTIQATTLSATASNIRYYADPPYRDGFIAKLDSNGDVLNTGALLAYSGSSSSTTNVDIKSMVIDANNYIYTIGSFSGGDIFQPFTLNRGGTTDMFVVRHESNTMTEQYVEQYSSAGSNFLPTVIAADASSMYIGGTITTNATVSSNTMTLHGTADGFVMKANKLTRTVDWARNFGGAGATVAVAAIGTQGGDIRVGAQFIGGDLTLPVLTRIGTSGQSAAVIGLTSTGSFGPVKAMGGDGTQVNLAPSQGMSADGMFVMVGSTNGDLTTPALTKTAANTTDALILRAAPPSFTVAITKTGTGTVTSSPGGLNCGVTCTSVGLADGTLVSLTAVADGTSTFAGWGGDCGGTTAATNLTLTGANATCTATFTLNTTPPPTPTPTPPAPPPPFVVAPPATIENASTVGSGSGSLSFASSFTNNANLTFSAAPSGGGSLPSWLSFDPASVSFNFNVPLPPDLPIQPLAAGDTRTGRADARATWSNTVYPMLLRVAQLPVVLTATDRTTGQSYASTIQMSFYAPRNPVAISAVSMSLDRALGNKSSGRSALSFDGGQMLFETASTNLFAASPSPYGDIVRYHGLSGARDRLSQTAIPGGGVANGADGQSSSPAVSADGAYGAFASDAPGVSETPAGGKRQVYRVSLAYPRVALNPAVTPAPLMVSATAAGVAGNGMSDNPSASQDGRYVAFDSTATNLAAGLDGTRRVWRKDLSTGELAQVGVGSNPSISWDGRFVAFEAAGQVQLKDLTTGNVRGVGAGTSARLSARADRVAFVQSSKVVQVELATGVTRQVGDGDQPAMSADGRFVAFRSVGANGNGFTQVWLRDVERGVTALVTQTAAGAGGNGNSLFPSVSGDGAQVGFVSAASDLVNGSPTGIQAYVAANPLPLPEKTGYWYLASSNSGQGWLMERWGNQAYVAGLVYDAAGQASWASGFCQVTGLTCAGTLVSRSGGTAFGAAVGPGPVAGAGVAFSLATSEDGRSTTLKVGDGAAQTLTMFPIGGTATTGFAGLPQAGWWMETGSTGGNGYFIAVDTQPQADGSVRQIAYVSILTFDLSGRPVWYSSQAALGSDLGFAGTLMQYGAPSGVSAIGQLRIAFTGSDTALINLPNGRTAAIGRFRF